MNLQHFVSANTGACSATSYMGRPAPGTADSSLDKGVWHRKAPVVMKDRAGTAGEFPGFLSEPPGLQAGNPSVRGRAEVRQVAERGKPSLGTSLHRLDFIYAPTEIKRACV